MDDDESCEGCDLCTPAPPIKARSIDFAILGLLLAAEIAQSVADALAAATVVASRHANYLKGQREFQNAVRLDIERLGGE